MTKKEEDLHQTSRFYQIVIRCYYISEKINKMRYSLTKKDKQNFVVVMYIFMQLVKENINFDQFNRQIRIHHRCVQKTENK